VIRGRNGARDGERAGEQAERGRICLPEASLCSTGHEARERQNRQLPVETGGARQFGAGREETSEACTIENVQIGTGGCAGLLCTDKKDVAQVSSSSARSLRSSAPAPRAPRSFRSCSHDAWSFRRARISVLSDSLDLHPPTGLTFRRSITPVRDIHPPPIPRSATFRITCLTARTSSRRASDYASLREQRASCTRTQYPGTPQRGRCACAAYRMPSPRRSQLGTTCCWRRGCRGRCHSSRSVAAPSRLCVRACSQKRSLRAQTWRIGQRDAHAGARRPCMRRASRFSTTSHTLRRTWPCCTGGTCTQCGLCRSAALRLRDLRHTPVCRPRCPSLRR
jgi:hypothetical protein